jgi:hypothetical protein
MIITIRCDISDLDLSDCTVYPPNGLHHQTEVEFGVIKYLGPDGPVEVLDCSEATYDLIAQYLIDGYEYERSEAQSGRDDYITH